ncbi:DUF317 domain-containing protein [Streptomyces sp. CL12]|uniref:DUF317 domain-containing protein n=1 Tax=Streptomyces sp. CL12 TaxID=3391744 RepID=UPI003A7FDEEE
MPSHSNDDFREYHITPRYLAGSTFTGDPAIRPLLDAGWHLSNDELGNCFVTAPEQTIRLGYLPEGEDDALWKITAYSDPFAMPRWLVTFQQSTPTEIVQEFTTALAAAYKKGPDSYLYYGKSELAALDVGTPLATAGWSHTYGRADVSFRSPDGLAEVHLRRTRLDHAAEMKGLQERWLMLGGPPSHQWYATASSFTPEGLVATMNTALTNPAPVVRYGYDLRRLSPLARATPVKTPVPTPLDVRRAVVAKARSPHGRSGAGAAPFIPAPRTPSAPQRPYQSHGR